MQNKVKQFIYEQELLPEDATIICAVSGGVDSVCLLHILHQLGYSLILAHVNHHKREQSIIEQQAMKKLAEQYHIPFELLEYYDKEKENFQSEAHYARYDFLKKLAIKYNTPFIATAHHLEDQAETILMRLITGSNLYGYAGISIKKHEDQFDLVRPLLCVSKEEIYSYAQKHQLLYFEDSSNASDDYLRNRIRHHILPLLQKENKNYLNKFQEFSIQAKDSFDFIRKQSINYLDKLNNNIEAISFNKLDSALKRDILCLWFERNHIERNYATIIRCTEILKQNKNTTYSLKGELFFQLEYGIASIQKRNSASSFEEKLELDNYVVILNRYKFYFSKKLPQNNEKYLKLWYNDLKLPFLIRSRRDGDFINMSYGKKKVARILIDEKIPTGIRNQIPLVFDHSEELLWVYGIARSKSVIEQKEKGDIYLVCEEV